MRKPFLFTDDAQEPLGSGDAGANPTGRAPEAPVAPGGRRATPAPRGRAPEGWPFWLAVPLQSPPEKPETFARRVSRSGGSAIELRADALAGLHGLSPEALGELAVVLRRAAPRLAILLTPRAVAEGGVADLALARREAIVETCLSAVDAVDIELSSPALLARTTERIERAGKRLILSYHDFSRTPPQAELDARKREAARWPGALLKIAAATPRRADLIRLAAWTQRSLHERPLATMGMGTKAGAGRLLLAVLGSRLAFAALGEASAPGQIELRAFASGLRRLRKTESVRAFSDRTASLSRSDARAGIEAILREAEHLLEEQPR